MTDMERRGKEYDLAPELVTAFAATFVNRFDCYPHQLRGKARYNQVKEPLTPDHLYQHLAGDLTLGTYALDPDNDAKWLCFDADNDEGFAALKQIARNLENQGVFSGLELSRRGGHLWIFFEPISGQNARRFAQQLLDEQGVTFPMEVYPRQDRIGDGVGSLMRLPFGVHQRSGRRYYFITPDGEPLRPTITQQLEFFTNPPRMPVWMIGRVLGRAPAPKLIEPSPKFEKREPVPGEMLSDSLKASISVLDFIGRYVDLDERGRGHCPFHDDDYVSFQVNANDNYWHCYANCMTAEGNKGGSIIDFWMKWRETNGQDGSFIEAITEMRGMLLATRPRKRREE
jgi:hypothetical protein